MKWKLPLHDDLVCFLSMKAATSHHQESEFCSSESPSVECIASKDLIAKSSTKFLEWLLKSMSHWACQKLWYNWWIKVEYSSEWKFLGMLYKLVPRGVPKTIVTKFFPIDEQPWSSTLWHIETASKCGTLHSWGWVSWEGQLPYQFDAGVALTQHI